MQIRYHHLLCFLGFRGFGYNNEFVEHFKNVYNYVYNNNTIKLIEIPDEICLKCPNFDGENCITEEKVRRIDKMVKSFLESNTKIKEVEYPSSLYSVISKMPLEYFDGICKDCQWYSLRFCKEGLRNLINLSEVEND